MPNIDIDLSESCYNTQQRDQLQRLLMKKQDLELVMSSVQHQIQQLTQAYTNMGITKNMLQELKPEQVNGIIINMLGVSPVIKDLNYARHFIQEQQNSINHQITTLKRNLQIEKKNMWEIDSKILDVYNKAHGTNIQMTKPNTVKRKKIYQQADQEINPEIEKLEKQLMEEIGDGS